MVWEMTAENFLNYLDIISDMNSDNAFNDDEIASIDYLNQLQKRF